MRRPPSRAHHPRSDAISRGPCAARRSQTRQARRSSTAAPREPARRLPTPSAGPTWPRRAAASSRRCPRHYCPPSQRWSGPRAPSPRRNDSRAGRAAELRKGIMGQRAGVDRHDLRDAHRTGDRFRMPLMSHRSACRWQAAARRARRSGHRPQWIYWCWWCRAHQPPRC